jgi:uncharacterized protein
VALLVTGTSSLAASFDCTKASNLVESLICADALLSSLDDALSSNYRTMMGSNIGDGARDDLRTSQRRWLQERNRCENRECLIGAYQLRIDAICDYPVVSGVHPGCVSADDVSVPQTAGALGTASALVSAAPGDGLGPPSKPADLGDAQRINDPDTSVGHEAPRSAESVRNIADAQRYLDADSGMQHVVMPLLSPDNKNYQVWGQIIEYDAQRKILIARVGTDRKPAYFAVILTDESIQFGGAAGRINGTISVVGEYIANERIRFQPSVVMLAKYIQFD